MRLNLGAGNDILEGAVNHDIIKHRPEIAVVHDLDVRPWPWADNSVDEIVARSVFEHLVLTLIETLDECWRILKPGGTLYVKVPYWKAEQAWMDPQHRWRWAPQVFDYFDPDTAYGKEYGYYTKRKWQIVKPCEMTSTAIHITLRVRK
jgi:predicted SAM-dependent methyltransferase